MKISQISLVFFVALFQSFSCISMELSLTGREIQMLTDLYILDQTTPAITKEYERAVFEQTARSRRLHAQALQIPSVLEDEIQNHKNEETNVKKRRLFESETISITTSEKSDSSEEETAPVLLNYATNINLSELIQKLNSRKKLADTVVAEAKQEILKKYPAKDDDRLKLVLSLYCLIEKKPFYIESINETVSFIFLAAEQQLEIVLTKDLARFVNATVAT